MKLLTRYVLREFLVPLGYCLAGFVSLFVLFELFGSFSRISSSDLAPLAVVEYFAAYIAPHVRWLAPAALMLATLYTMWTLCRNSEIVAMRASGVSFPAIVKPVLLVAAAAAAFVAWVDESYVPARAQWAARLKAARFDLERMAKADNIVFRNSRADRVWSADDAEDDACEHLVGVKVTVDRPGGGRLLTVTAERADWLDGEWWFTRPSVRHYSERGEAVASPTPELDALELRAFPEFRERPGDILAQNRSGTYGSVREKLRFTRINRDLTDAQRRRYLYDAWAQALAPLACVVITLFAIPAGIASGRQSVFRGIIGALAMFFAFYALTVGCLVAAYKGWLHHIPAAVLPHAVFFILGLRSFRLRR